jgi:hypothetical protein
MVVDGPIIVALAALGGSLIGGGSSVAAALIGQRVQARWRRLAAELEEREKLYGLFVEEAVPLFIDALQQTSIDPGKLMRLYSKIARIRLSAGNRVLRAAEQVAERLLEAYDRPRRLSQPSSNDMREVKPTWTHSESSPKPVAKNRSTWSADTEAASSTSDSSSAR